MADRTLTIRWVADDFVLVFDHTDALDDREWDTFVDALVDRPAGPMGVRILVYNAGGGPNAAQRARFDRRLRGRPTRIAVICTSLFPRAIIKAFHLMGFLHVTAFSPDQEEGAFRHLRLSAAEIASLREELAKIRGGSRPQPAAGA
ncbi:MAG TPA: hypothetical protein VFS43_33015 [Polyangiaceae bacterium]|nr:hypothetical protein [Polyangiaceae bacterium]